MDERRTTYHQRKSLIAGVTNKGRSGRAIGSKLTDLKPPCSQNTGAHLESQLQTTALRTRSQHRETSKPAHGGSLADQSEGDLEEHQLIIIIFSSFSNKNGQFYASCKENAAHLCIKLLLFSFACSVNVGFIVCSWFLKYNQSARVNFVCMGALDNPDLSLSFFNSHGHLLLKLKHSLTSE